MNKYIPRKLEGEINKYIDGPEIVAVVGPRQCGKTTMLRHIAERLDNSTFLSFEDHEVLELFETNIKQFAKLYTDKYKYVFIDEFQYSKIGGKQLKFLYDLHHTKIFISGSSAIDLTINAVKYLVGRVLIMSLYPLDFIEFIGYKDKKYQKYIVDSQSLLFSSENIKINEGWHKKLMSLYEEYIIFGGYPRIVLENDNQIKIKKLKDIYNTYFLRDVKDFLGLTSNYKLSKLIKLLALQIGKTVDYNQLASQTGFSHASVKKYMNFLEQTFICNLITPYYTNKISEIVKNPRVYFLDTGLRNHIAGDFNVIGERLDSGFFLENAVYQQIIKKGIVPQYWRTKKQLEMDFVLEINRRNILALEVKKTLHNINWDSIKFFQEKYPNIDIKLMYWEKKNDKLQIPHYPIYFA